VVPISAFSFIMASIGGKSLAKKGYFSQVKLPNTTLKMQKMQ